MSTVFSRDSDTYTPTLVTGYQSSSRSGVLVHPIPGSDDAEFTERPGGKRSGTLEVLFAEATSEADSRAFELALLTGEQMDIVSDDRTSVDMTFYATGSVERELEDATRDIWLVRFEFMEV